MQDGGSGKKIVPFKEYIELQVGEILSPENMYYTGLEVGHEPTTDEAARHYAECGGAAHFAEVFVPKEVVEKTNVPKVTEKPPE